MEEAPSLSKGHEFKRFYKNHSYKLIVECSKNEMGNFMRILKIQKGDIRKVIVLGESAYRGCMNLRDASIAFFTSVGDLRMSNQEELQQRTK